MKKDKKNIIKEEIIGNFLGPFMDGISSFVDEAEMSHKVEVCLGFEDFDKRDNFKSIPAIKISIEPISPDEVPENRINHKSEDLN